MHVAVYYCIHHALPYICVAFNWMHDYLLFSCEYMVHAQYKLFATYSNTVGTTWSDALHNNRYSWPSPRESSQWADVNAVMLVEVLVVRQITFEQHQSTRENRPSTNVPPRCYECKLRAVSTECHQDSVVHVLSTWMNAFREMWDAHMAQNVFLFWRVCELERLVKCFFLMTDFFLTGFLHSSCVKEWYTQEKRRTVSLSPISIQTLHFDSVSSPTTLTLHLNPVYIMTSDWTMQLNPVWSPTTLHSVVSCVLSGETSCLVHQNCESVWNCVPNSEHVLSVITHDMTPSTKVLTESVTSHPNLLLHLTFTIRGKKNQVDSTHFNPKGRYTGFLNGKHCPTVICQNLFRNQHFGCMHLTGLCHGTKCSGSAFLVSERMLDLSILVLIVSSLVSWGSHKCTHATQHLGMSPRGTRDLCYTATCHHTELCVLCWCVCGGGGTSTESTRRNGHG